MTDRDTDEAARRATAQRKLEEAASTLNVHGVSIQRALDQLAAARLQIEKVMAATAPARRQIEKVMAATAPARRQIEKVMATTAPARRRMAEALGPIAAQWQMAAEAMGPALAAWERSMRPFLPHLRRAAEVWADFHKRYRIAADEAAPALAKYKWFVTPSLPVSFIFEVVEVARRRGRRDKQMNALFLDYFAADNWRNLEEMVDGWRSNPLFTKRMKILRDCVGTLQLVPEGRLNAANLVLPTLIAQIDGLLSDYLRSEGISWLLAYDDRPAGAKGVRAGRKGQFRRHRGRRLPASLEVAADFVFLDILFQGAQPGHELKTPFNFNRHKIMHGENVRYGRKDYVVRAFMVLDFLAHLD